MWSAWLRVCHDPSRSIISNPEAPQGRGEGSMKRSTDVDDAPRRKKVRFLSEIVSQPAPMNTTYVSAPGGGGEVQDDQAVPEINVTSSAPAGAASDTQEYPPRGGLTRRISKRKYHKHLSQRRKKWMSVVWS